MKKGNMRLFTISACIVLGLFLAGCGGDETKTKESAPAATEAAVEEESHKADVDSLPKFELSTTGIEDGKWKQSTGGTLDNRSPELSWDAVDGASRYAVIMLDNDANNWLHWYVTVDKTHLQEGEFANKKSGYYGPYPPYTHEYAVYVVALAGEPKDAYFVLDSTGKDINSKLEELDIASDGSAGNVLAYGMVSAKFTPAK